MTPPDHSYLRHERKGEHTRSFECGDVPLPHRHRIFGDDPPFALAAPSEQYRDDSARVVAGRYLFCGLKPEWFTAS